MSLREIASEDGEVNPSTVRRYILLKGIALRADSSVQTYDYISPCAGAIRLRGTWELKYAEVLDYWYGRGQILKWDYEAGRIRLDPNHWYMPDFGVYDLAGARAYHEVKGYMREHSRAKLARVRECGVPVVLITGRLLKAICAAHGIKVKI